MNIKFQIQIKFYIILSIFVNGNNNINFVSDNLNFPGFTEKTPLFPGFQVLKKLDFIVQYA